MLVWAGMDEYQKTDIPELIYRFDLQWICGI